MTLNQAQRRQWINRWHRRIAVVVCLWLLVLAVTGFLINHANDWGLDLKPLPAVLQSSFYGLEREDTADCPKKLAGLVDCGTIFGAFDLPLGPLFISKPRLFLFDASGELLESASAGSLGLSQVQAASWYEERLYLRDGRVMVSLDADLMNPVRVQANQVASSGSMVWQSADSGQDLISWERLLLDIHAARFLGPLAKWFNDIAALLIVLLALSGIWLYFRAPALRSNGRNNRSS